jgi:hypothetical protein
MRVSSDLMEILAEKCFASFCDPALTFAASKSFPLIGMPNAEDRSA